MLITVDIGGRGDESVLLRSLNKCKSDKYWSTLMISRCRYLQTLFYQHFAARFDGVKEEYIQKGEMNVKEIWATTKSFAYNINCMQAGQARGRFVKESLIFCWWSSLFLSLFPSPRCSLYRLLVAGFRSGYRVRGLPQTNLSDTPPPVFMKNVPIQCTYILCKSSLSVPS